MTNKRYTELTRKQNGAGQGIHREKLARSLTQRTLARSC